MKKGPILIIAAMDSEIDFLKTKLEDIKIKEENIYKFYEGKISEYPVVICKCNIMTINSAIATYISIEKYNPAVVINEGTAGGHGKDVHRGDIVIGEKCINILSSETPVRNENEGSSSLEWELLSFISGEENRLIQYYADKELLELSKSVNYELGNVHIGIIGSGDVWNKEVDRINMLNERYGTLCEDMEAISIYTVCNNFNVPVISIKIVSNNEILGEEYERKLGINSQKFTYELINKIIKKDDN